MSNDRVMKSYVWHGEKCFFVSTIERDSSAAFNPMRYNETLVWNYDWHKAQRLEMIHQDEDSPRRIVTHIRVCESLFATGLPENKDDES